MGEYDRGNLFVFAVTPCVGVWIEILDPSCDIICNRVTPCVGVWIEIKRSVIWSTRTWSLPVWECGLKFQSTPGFVICINVTPCVGVWIEILKLSSHQQLSHVTPCVGVWIEISVCLHCMPWSTCHSLCGSVDWNRITTTWPGEPLSHSLYGSVDWNAWWNYYNL